MTSEPRRLAISFSGGETSATMTALLLAANEYDETIVMFANTGQERDETLEFVHACDQHFGFNVVWVEAVVHHNRRMRPTARVVTYETAARISDDHGPFHDSIRKYGIPNQKFPDCTRNLKRTPIEAYLAEQGWKVGEYDLAIGIRRDEMDRISHSEEAKRRRLIYPLATRWPMSKPQVNAWWDAQPFRLRLKGYEGNCAWCWKKSFRKHYTLLLEAPDLYDFPREMEARYGTHGPEFRKQGGEVYDPEKHSSKRGLVVDPLPEDYRRTFFRGNKSVKDLEAAVRDLPDTFEPSPDDHVVYEDFDPELDVGGGCGDGESCEVFGD